MSHFPFFSFRRGRSMTEGQETRALAHRILDRPYADPDDDLAMLSRQLLRADEQIANLTNIDALRVTNAEGLLRTIEEAERVRIVMEARETIARAALEELAYLGGPGPGMIGNSNGNDIAQRAYAKCFGNPVPNVRAG
jgi:hypothetical protein